MKIKDMPINETNPTGLVGNSMETTTGQHFCFRHPEPGMININDIADGLARANRAGGQGEAALSVAEHSVKCCNVAITMNCSVEECLAVLLHDAHEAYTGDIPKPLKVLLMGIDAVEERIDEAIFKAFNIRPADKHLVKSIDNVVWKCERKHLHPNSKLELPGFDKVGDFGIPIHFWKEDEARFQFLDLFKILMDRRIGERALESPRSSFSAASSIVEQLEKYNKAGRSGDKFLHDINRYFETDRDRRQASETSCNAGSAFVPRKHQHYFKSVEGIDEIDVYKVLDLFECNDAALTHAIKKLLVPGKRGAKDRRKDVTEAIDTLNRWVEIQDEQA